MIENIKQEFIKIIQETEWMDDFSKNLALDKVDLTLKSHNLIKFLYIYRI